MRLLVGAASVAIIACSAVYLGGLYSAHAAGAAQAKADAKIMRLSGTFQPASRICFAEQSLTIQSADILSACTAAGYY